MFEWSPRGGRRTELGTDLLSEDAFRATDTCERSSPIIGSMAHRDTLSDSAPGSRLPRSVHSRGRSRQATRRAGVGHLVAKVRSRPRDRRLAAQQSTHAIRMARAQKAFAAVVVTSDAFTFDHEPEPPGCTRVIALEEPGTVRYETLVLHSSIEGPARPVGRYTSSCKSRRATCSF
jgi:hypothetical protein